MSIGRLCLSLGLAFSGLLLAKDGHLYGGITWWVLSLIAALECIANNIKEQTDWLKAAPTEEEK